MPPVVINYYKLNLLIEKNNKIKIYCRLQNYLYTIIDIYIYNI